MEWVHLHLRTENSAFFLRYLFFVDVSVPDDFAYSVLLIIVFDSLQTLDPSQSDWLGSVRCLCFKAILVWVTHASKVMPRDRIKAVHYKPQLLIISSTKLNILLQLLSTNMHDNTLLAIRQQPLSTRAKVWVMVITARTIILTSLRIQWKTEQIKMDWKHQCKGAKSTMCTVVKYVNYPIGYCPKSLISYLTGCKLPETWAGGSESESVRAKRNVCACVYMCALKFA